MADHIPIERDMSVELLNINSLVNGVIKAYKSYGISQVFDPEILKSTLLRFDKMSKGIRSALVARLKEKGYDRLLPVIWDLDYEEDKLTYNELEPQFQFIESIFEKLFLENKDNPIELKKLTDNFESFIASMIGHLRYELSREGIQVPDYDN